MISIPIAGLRYSTGTGPPTCGAQKEIACFHASAPHIRFSPGEDAVGPIYRRPDQRFVSMLPALKSPASDSFLAVEQSVTGRRWKSRLDGRGEARAMAIAQQAGVSELL